MSTRTVEVIRVGTIDLDINYPGKQLVRLRDLSALYEGGSVKDLKELHDRLRGKRLSAINVEVWDQISGAYLGSYNTDENGTLILPTDKKFVEVLHWKLAGGGYSDCFNGEPAASMPGLFFYFPCNEYEGKIIKSFPGVSGQRVDMSEMTTPWEWYDSGFFNRPALKVISDTPQPLQLFGATPVGKRSFQFLWYCNDPSPDRTIFQYSSSVPIGMGADFALEVYYDGEKSVLRGVLAVGTSDQQYGTGDPPTELSAETWYLIQINTLMYGSYQMVQFSGFWLEMDVYLGETIEPEISMQGCVEASPQRVNIRNTPLVAFSGGNNDGFDELRHLDRELYLGEISDYGTFIKQGRVSGKSKGSLGSAGW